VILRHFASRSLREMEVQNGSECFGLYFPNVVRILFFELGVFLKKNRMH